MTSMSSLHSTFGSPIDAYSPALPPERVRFHCRNDPQCRTVSVGGVEWVLVGDHRIDDYVELTG